MPPRICMVCPQFAPTIGGAEQQAEDLARELQRRGSDVFVLTQSLPGAARWEDLRGLEVFRAIAGLRFGFVFGLAYLASTLRFLWRKRRDYDLIHCHTLYLHTVAAVLVARACGKKVLVKVACTRDYGDLAVLGRMAGASLLLAVLRRADLFVAISSEVAAELRGAGVPESRIRLVPNFVDVDHYRPAAEKGRLRRELLLPEGVAIVLFAGRLTPQKGLPHLLEAWSRLAARRRGALLVLLGDGSAAADLKAAGSRLGIAASVRFAGATDNVRDYLQAADLFVLPSLSEGMPNALLQAMACGLPCVATNIGGARDMISDGSDGLLVEPGDAAALGGAIARLLTDGALAVALGTRARATAESRYARARVVPEYSALYRELLSPCAASAAS